MYSLPYNIQCGGSREQDHIRAFVSANFRGDLQIHSLDIVKTGDVDRYRTRYKLLDNLL